MGLLIGDGMHMPLKVSKKTIAACKGLLSTLHFLFSYPWGNTYHGFPYLLNVDGKQAFFSSHVVFQTAQRHSS